MSASSRLLSSLRGATAEPAAAFSGEFAIAKAQFLSERNEVRCLEKGRLPLGGGKLRQKIVGRIEAVVTAGMSAAVDWGR
jgi:hypothetical protein